MLPNTKKQRFCPCYGVPSETFCFLFCRSAFTYDIEQKNNAGVDCRICACDASKTQKRNDVQSGNILDARENYVVLQQIGVLNFIPIALSLSPGSLC